MNKDYFERSIGEKLRGAQAQVPAGAWNLIQAKLQVQGAPAHTGGFGFGAALVAGGMLLLGLAAHSSLESGENTPAAAYVAELNISEVSTSESEPAKASAEETSLSVTDTPATKVIQYTASSEADELPSDPVALPRTVVNMAETQVAEQLGSEVTTPSVRPTDPSFAEEQSAPKQQATETPEIVTGGIPDAVTAAEEAPFSAAIRTSGSFGYAPFTVSFENQGTSSGQVWDFGPYGKSTEKNPVVVFDKPGLYSVMLSAYRGDDEQKIEFITIEVEEGSSLFVPNSFTPDGDGQNEVFQAKGSKLASFMLTVVDSKGAIVFQTLDIDEPWRYDHAVHGQDGAFYIAVVRAEGIDGQAYNVRHRINIIY